jgi:hypothetical protein
MAEEDDAARFVFLRSRPGTRRAAISFAAPGIISLPPLSGQHGFEASHACALGPTGSQDVACCLHLSLLVTHRDCILISHQGIITPAPPSADEALRPSAAT